MGNEAGRIYPANSFFNLLIISHGAVAFGTRIAVHELRISDQMDRTARTVFNAAKKIDRNVSLRKKV